jgi:hypothetical protein
MARPRRRTLEAMAERFGPSILTMMEEFALFLSPTWDRENEDDRRAARDALDSFLDELEETRKTRAFRDSVHYWTELGEADDREGAGESVARGDQEGS